MGSLSYQTWTASAQPGHPPPLRPPPPCLSFSLQAFSSPPFGAPETASLPQPSSLGSGFPEPAAALSSWAPLFHGRDLPLFPFFSEALPPRFCSFSSSVKRKKKRKRKKEKEKEKGKKKKEKKNTCFQF